MSPLTVIECPYSYAAWTVAREGDGLCYTSREQRFEHREMTEDYRACGVYGAAGVPFEVHRLGERGAKDPLHVSIPREVSDLVCTTVASGGNVLLASGYCVYVPAMLGGLQRALGEGVRIGMVWIDAHADSVVIERSAEATTTLVGVPVSTALGLTCPDWRVEACGLMRPLHAGDVVMSDLRSSDEETLATVQNAGCVMIDEAGFEDGTVWKHAVRELANRVDVIHVAIDADILRPEFVPAYYRVETGGHTPWKVLENLSCVFETGKVRTLSTLCFDFDKGGVEGDATCLNGMRIIAGALSQWGGQA